MRVSVRSTAEPRGRGSGGAPLALPEPAAAPLRVRRERHRPRRVADGRHVLPRARAGIAAVRRGGRRRRAGPDAVHPRGDEAHERGEGGARGDRPPHPRRERPAGRVRPGAVRPRAARPAARSTPSRQPTMFNRVLVANRGEIAVRVIRALHELGIEAVAVYSTADEDALHVRLADRAVRIGPPPAAESYLSIPAIVAAATTTGCEAVHPGYGFLSENDDFVRACEDNDLVFIGPPADVMARMGDKAQAKAEMRAAGVPLVPGTEGTATLAGGARGRGRARLSRAAEGGGRRRRARHAARRRRRRARRRVRARLGRGAGRVLRRDALRREGDLAGAARRDPGALRHLRRRADLRRARVLDPAAAPEADRGVAVARARRRRSARRWRRRPSARAGTSATGTRARSSSSSGRTARSPSSS